MRVIALRTLREYWQEHADARQSLQAWHDYVKKASWKSPQELARDYGQDVILPDNRAVFKIKGNQFRLVVRINYPQEIVFIRFIGTHSEYDKIDATRI